MMADIQVDLHTEIFNEVFIPHLENMSRTQIFYGGASSGKSVFLAQRCIHDILRGKRNYLILRQVATTVRHSVFREVCNIISTWGISHLFHIKQAEMTITCDNGYQVLFAGLDDVEKLKSIVPAKGAITDIWVEEATETAGDSIKQLYKRQRGGDKDVPKRLTMSFNPILQSHWIFERYFSAISWTDKQTEYKSDALSILKTWYVHNKFLTPDDISDLENETDKYFYDVYTLGNWGILGNVIFTNWRVEDLSDMQDQFTNTRNGLDFGFADDPAALSRSHYDKMRKTIYIFKEVYERGLTNPMLAREIKPHVGQELVVCDSAEPKSIQELKNEGINATGARKGKDSVNFGIQWLQQQTIIVDARCINARNELLQYKWKEDRAGNVIRQPVDKNNHLIDATRYAYEDDMEGIHDAPRVGWA